MSRFMLAVILVVGLSEGTMLASAASRPATRPRKVAASIIATFSAPAALPCTNGTSYAATCPGSSGACSCITITGSATGGLGKGLVAGALTLDGLDATPETGCTPFFGSLAVTNSRDTSVNTIDVTGALCDSTPSGGVKTLGGGFDFDPATVTLDGTGSISGTVGSGGNARLKLVGVLAPAPIPSPTATGTAGPTATPTP
jgi:hypothetical protein